MKTRLAILFYLVSILTLSAQKVFVFTPNGGEEWQKGSRKTISWNNSEITAGSFKITLWRNGTNLGVIATNLPAEQNTFGWTVGRLQGAPDAPVGSGYTIRVKVQGKSISDTSDRPFTIRLRPLTSGVETGTNRGSRLNRHRGFLDAQPGTNIPPDPCTVNQKMDARLEIEGCTFGCDPNNLHVNYSITIQNNSRRCLKEILLTINMKLSDSAVSKIIHREVITDTNSTGGWTLRGNARKSFPGGFYIPERYAVCGETGYAERCDGNPSRKCLILQVIVTPNDVPGQQDIVMTSMDIGPIE